MTDPFGDQRKRDHRLAADDMRRQDRVALQIDFPPFQQGHGGCIRRPVVVDRRFGAGHHAADEHLDRTRIGMFHLGHHHGGTDVDGDQIDGLVGHGFFEGRRHHPTIPGAPVDGGDPAFRPLQGHPACDLVEGLVGHGVIALAGVARAGTHR